MHTFEFIRPPDQAEAIATAALVRFNSTMLNGSDGGREWRPQGK